LGGIFADAAVFLCQKYSCPAGIGACAEKLSLLSWRFKNRFFKMPYVVVSPAEAGRLSLS
jgi:hypothetical protein